MPLTNALAQEIAREFGTPAVVIDLDRVEANIARVQAAVRQPRASPTGRTSRRTRAPCSPRCRSRAGARGITCQKLGEAEVMVERRPRRYPHQLQPPGRGEGRPPGPAAAARGDHRRRRQPDHHRRPAAGRRDRRARPRRRHRVRHGPQARRRRDRRARRSRSPALIKAQPGLRFDGLPVLSDRDRPGRRRSAFFDEALAGHPRARARAAHRLDRRHAEPRQLGAARRRHRAPRRHLHLQRPHDAGLRRRTP